MVGPDVVSNITLVLHDPGDKFRGVALGGRGLVVLVLKQVAAGREVPQELPHQLDLFPGGGLRGAAGIDAVHSLAGGDVTDVVAEMGDGPRWWSATTCSTG